MARSGGLVALLAASSGIAGVLLEGGYSGFKIPIHVKEQGGCQVAGGLRSKQMFCMRPVYIPYSPKNWDAEVRRVVPNQAF
eukprot:358188-Chlamydomonas_euryale.AAC.6